MTEQEGDSLSNRLQYETSPYLLQHKDNPVDWYPWCEEAFARARSEDRPIFLSIGYSACHWCHVLAHESFEDEEIAGILNRYYISIKVDKEERPDIDSVYMAVCQAFTGSGGWPTSIFMTPNQKPLFAGTYFPRTTRAGAVGMRELLLLIHEKWVNDRGALLRQAEMILAHLRQENAVSQEEGADSGQKSSGAGQTKNNAAGTKKPGSGQMKAGGAESDQNGETFKTENGVSSQEKIIPETKGQTTAGGILSGQAGTVRSDLIQQAVQLYKRMFDRKYGGFGQAPKFPAPHNLLFLLSYYERTHDMECLVMAEYTLLQMYRGGMFDHIGSGFCRYSTDEKFLVPHFEKMLYDNALLILAYCKTYALSRKQLYLEIAKKTADYVLRELTVPGGSFAGGKETAKKPADRILRELTVPVRGFASAQDADSEGEEGKYYLFTPDEVIHVLGREEGEAFNCRFDITEAGNFAGKNIPNLLNSNPGADTFGTARQKLDEYRKKRTSLHLDGKVLAAWNSLMIAALCELYLVSRDERYLAAAKGADAFIQEHLCESETLYVSFCGGKRGVKGFLDDYAGYAFAQLGLYKATLEESYLEKACRLCDRAMADFEDKAGGFYLYGKDSEALILRPKETYDGAIPSGNSLMAYNLARLSLLTEEEKYRDAAERQIEYLSAEAEKYPPGYAMFLTAFLEYNEPRMKITIVPDEQEDRKQLVFRFPPELAVLLKQPDEKQPLINGRTTYYVCRGHVCLPPVNDLRELSGADRRCGSQDRSWQVCQ